MLNEMFRFIRAKAPLILSITGCVGVVATAVSAVKAVPNAKLRVGQAELQKGEPLTGFEMAIAMAPAYIPTTVIGAGTMACILSSAVISQNRISGLSSAYAMLYNSFSTYRNTAKKVYGDDADEKISNQIAMDNFKNYCIDQDDLACREEVGSAEIPLFYDEYGNRYFNRTMLDVQTAEYHLNRNLALRGYCSLNEFFRFLGLEGIPGGDDIGWGYDEWYEDGMAWIDFYHHKTSTDDGLECYIIRFMFDPQPLGF